MLRPINPAHQGQRTALRVLGFVLVLCGGVLTAVGLVGFFRVFANAGSGGPPTRVFWALLGVPMLGFGVALLRMGYLGTIARYVAGEATPVAKDVLNDVAAGTEHAVRTVAGAIGAGLRAAPPVGRCRSCSAELAAGARFCSQCGEGQQAAADCPACSRPLPPGTRFCSHCGQKVTA